MSGRATVSAAGPLALLASGCGTAIASVCALGLIEIQRRLSGLWAVAAVLIAGLLCAVLARTFARLTEVVPSGAGLPAFLSRAFGRHVGLRLTLPYLVLMIALAGVEARIVGALLGEALGIPRWPGALAFLVVTWAVCRLGVRPGYGAQVMATACLMAVLTGLAVAALTLALRDGGLREVAGGAPPSPTAFLAGVGQAFFLFMGFELVTSHVEVAGSAHRIGVALRRSVLILTLFYGLVAAGFAATRPLAVSGAGRWLMTPQLALAAATGSRLVLWAVVAACLLASYTSFNGALLALSRLVQVLAGQGVFPRGLSRVDPRRLVPGRALDLLLAASAAAATLIAGRPLTLLVLGGAGATATLTYASALWAREGAPFREAGRPPRTRLWAAALATALLLLGGGALIEAAHEALLGGPSQNEVAHAR
jgi:amino acid transporter